MTQHFSKRTVEAPFYCGKCGRTTQHRIDDGRKGPCLKCIERLELAHNLAHAHPAVKPASVRDRQQNLFGEST